MSRAGPALRQLRAIAHRYKIRTDFPADVLAEIEELGADTGGGDLEDLTALPFITIDNPDSKDLDQALFIEDVGGDTPYRVLYALADASYFAPPDSAIFAEALRRGVTQYFPGFAHPMLPRRLSEDLVSLNPDVERRALVFHMSLDREGQCRSTRFSLGRIRSQAKLSYQSVQHFFDGRAPEAKSIGGAAFADSMRLLRTVGRLRQHDAAQRDVVRYDRREVTIDLPSPDARTLRLSERKRLAVEEWNAQISLMCNIEGAKFLVSAKDPSLDIEGIFRVHPPPEPKSIDDFATWIESLVATLGLDADRWLWRRGTSENISLADYIEALPDDGEEARLSTAIQRQAMLLNQKASFSVNPAGHHGIGAPYYSRFSSPMREAVGILTHHLALSQQEGRAAALSREMVDEAIRVGNDSKDLQKKVSREARELAISHLLRQDLKSLQRGGGAPVRHGTLMGITASRLYVRLDSPPVDIKVYLDLVEKHGGPALESDESGIRLLSDGKPVGHVGGHVGLKTMAYEKRRRRWVMVPVL